MCWYFLHIADHSSLMDADVCVVLCFDLKQQFSSSLWMPDEVCLSCYGCQQKFTVIRRRHHCRICGQVFCSDCCHLQDVCLEKTSHS